MLVAYAAMFVLGSAMAATAITPGLFIAGHVIQGRFTSMMLIAAAPPLVTGWGAHKLPYAASVMNLGVLGAVAAGPVIGGVQASAGEWRPLFWMVTAVGALALLMAVLTFEDQPPQDPDAPQDWVAILLAGAGCSAAFFGASELATHRMLDLIVFLPLLVGVGLLVALVIHEYAIEDPLMPVRQLASTLPIAGIVIAMSAGAGSIAAVELTQTAFATLGSPVHTGMLFWPELGGAVFTAFVFGAVIWRRRCSPRGSRCARLSCRACSRCWSCCAESPRFCAPILAHLASTTGASMAAGGQIAMWVCFAIAAAGGSFALDTVVLGRFRLQAPDIATWEDGEMPAWHSPRFADAIRAPVQPSTAEALAAWEARTAEIVRLSD